MGRIHRGTPWQTVYLKSPDVTTDLSGARNWQIWSGNPNASDALLARPVSDWQLVSALAPLLNTNDVRGLFSINNLDTNAWTSLLNGLTAFTNTSTQLDVVVIESNSPQAALVADALVRTRASEPMGYYHALGDVLAVPELSVASPWLNTNDVFRITDKAYEIIPSQLLALLRADSVGSLTRPDGELALQFSGLDDYAYITLTSPDLTHWTAISTNRPTNGVFKISPPAPEAGEQSFFRSVLAPSP